MSVETRARRSARGAQARRRPSYYAPLALATFVAAHAALAAITMTTDEPLYEFLLHAIVTIGMALSFIGALTRRSFSFIGGAIMLAAFTAYAIRFQRGLPLTTLAYPAEVVDDSEVGLAALVGWFLVGFSFMQSRRENLVFVAVSGLTIFGLMATRNLNPEMLGTFGVFLFASVYCWGYDHFLDALETSRREINWRQWARAHLSGAALLFVIVAAGGAIAGNALYYTTPRLYGGFGLSQRILNWSGAQISGYFLFRNSFRVGGGPIRLSQEPILKVRAERASLWRGRVYDRYDGHGWSREFQQTRPVKRAGKRAFSVRKLAQRTAAQREPPSRSALSASVKRCPIMEGGAGSPGLEYGGAMRPPREGMAAAPASSEARGPPGLGPWDPRRPGLPMAPMAPEQQPRPEPQWRFPPLKGRKLRQEMTVLSHTTTSVFTAPHAYKIELARSRGPLDATRGSAVLTDSYGSLQTRAMMYSGQQYTVWSRAPEFTTDELRAAKAGGYSKRFREQYIEQTSLEVVAGLGPLVEEITAGKDNDYDRALAIQQYLERTCAYTLNPPITPVGKDPVVFFVTTSRRGACDLFASAMTLMARLAGIPARIATGFNTGKYDLSEDAFIVRGLDAHAWSEVHFGGLGWTPCDPSAQRSLEGLSLAALWRLGRWRLAVRSFGGFILISLGVLLGLYMVASALVDPRPLLASVWRRCRRRRPEELLAADYVKLTRLVARRARLPYRPGLTPRELLDAAAQAPPLRSRPDLLRALRAVTEAFYELRYGRKHALEAVARLRRNAAEMRRALRRTRRAEARPPTEVGG